MKVKIAFIMDPIESIKPKKDTTLALMEAAQRLGWELYYTNLQNIWFQEHSLAELQPIQVRLNTTDWFQFQGPTQIMALGDLDIIMMRKDPPFDREYIYATYLLERAQTTGSLVVNRPQSLRDCNEKFFATEFPQCTPPLMVAKDMKKLRQFHQQHQDVIFKPLDGMGGSAIFRVKADDSNLGVILETLTQHNTVTIMAQKYLPEIKEGDKRILMINGKAVSHCLARIPAPGEGRGNLAAGGQGVVQPLSARDQWIADQVGPKLQQRGIIFAGIDVIGDYLTEINVTSPTCVREIAQETGLDIAVTIMQAIAQQRRFNQGTEKRLTD